jgi:exocyst complex component 4
VPAFVVEVTTKSVFDYAVGPQSVDDKDGRASPPSGDAEASKKQQTKLQQFLTRLAQRPGNLPSSGESIDEGVPLEDLLGQRTDEAGSKAASASVPRSGSVTSLNRPGMTPSASAASGLGIAASSSMSAGLSGGLDLDAGASDSPSFNPEQDSFGYIEAILESLAYLGKLGHAMDTVLQRTPIEIYNLIEATVVDVDERNDPVRRNSMRIARFGASPKTLFSGTFGAQNSAAYSLLIRSSMSNATSLAATDEASVVAMHTEILMDFFWTVYSKLDAILQGFRVLHEVVQRIVSRKSFRDGSLQAKSGGALFSLYDVWRPVQFEVGSSCFQQMCI